MSKIASFFGRLAGGRSPEATPAPPPGPIERLAGIDATLSAIRRGSETAPNSAAGVAMLAEVLRVRSATLAELERFDEAAASAQERIGLFRLPAAQDPEGLADALQAYGVIESLAGRDDAGLPAIEESVGLLRDLATADPQAAEAALAEALDNQARVLGATGRMESALESISAALEIRRRLATRDHDRLSDVSDTLIFRSSVLRSLGRSQAAAADRDEGLEIARQKLADSAARVFASLAELERRLD